MKLESLLLTPLEGTKATTQSPERQRENRRMQALSIIEKLEIAIRESRIESAKIVRDIVRRAWTEEDGTDDKKTEVVLMIDEIIRHLEHRIDEDYN